MAKVLFFDTSNDGHHYLYNHAVMKGLVESQAVSEVGYYSFLYDLKKTDELKNCGVKAVTPALKDEDLPGKGNAQRARLLFNLIGYARRNKVKHIHLLYLDSLFIALVILAPLLWKFDLTATLHWFPKRKSKQVLLKALLKLRVIKKLVVHGEFTKEQVVKLLNEKETTDKVISVVYPNLHTEIADQEIYKVISKQLDGYNKPYLLAFGGLRHDKGIDILLEALALVEEKLTLIIAGAEDYFSQKDMEELINKYKLEDKVYLNLRFISNKELAVYFELADIVVLPYRAYFSGQSGPLTEGVTRSKVIVGPSSGEIGHTINYYGLGNTFIAEDIYDLAKKISLTVRNLEAIQENVKPNQQKYQNLLSLKSFVSSYNSFFKRKS
jgi:glycosyltransferase involved in cell wall biosynthesis